MSSQTSSIPPRVFTVVTPATPSINFSFKPAAATPATITPSATSTAPINFSFKPQKTAVKSEATADIGMEDDGLDSALAGTNICSPTNTGSGFGIGFSSFGGNTFGQQQQPSAIPAVQNNPFGGGFAAAAKTNGSAFGGTSAFGSAVKNPFGGGGGNTGFSSFGGAFGGTCTFGSAVKNPFGGGGGNSGFSSFGGGFSQQQQQQQPSSTTTSTPQPRQQSSTPTQPFTPPSTTNAQQIDGQSQTGFDVSTDLLVSPSRPYTKELIGGRFLLDEKPMNREGSVEIRFAEDFELKRKCVVKMFKLGIGRLECELLRKLEHEYIIKYIKEIEVNNRVFLFMEMGEISFSIFMIKFPKIVFDQFLDISYQMIQSLAHIHRKGVVHADIKASNYVIVDKTTVKLIDFGLATYYTKKLEKNKDSKKPKKLICLKAVDVLMLGRIFVNMVETECNEHREEYGWGLSNDVADMIHGCVNDDPLKRYTSAELAKHPAFEEINDYYSM
uniref:Protein kinase domain-containing protein n=1 Tax=Panagrolaimus sp. PS1159 TaxID=55785 RepID=A0AC35FL35_9BILA